jgi:hypothetical protein
MASVVRPGAWPGRFILLLYALLGRFFVLNGGHAALAADVEVVKLFADGKRKGVRKAGADEAVLTGGEDGTDIAENGV